MDGLLIHLEFEHLVFPILITSALLMPSVIYLKWLQTAYLTALTPRTHANLMLGPHLMEFQIPTELRALPAFAPC
jgi:hypothetical protein